MTLPLVDPFYLPYEAWQTRHATLEEMLAAGKPIIYVNETLKARVSTAHEAAIYMADEGADNGLGNFIQDALDNSPEYKSWRKAMPSATPAELSRYQKSYPKCDFDQVSKEIDAVGGVLSEGQCLFHGGLWNGCDSHVTDRPFSTSLCPQVALRNADHKGKAYDAGRIDLLVLRAMNPITKAFVFKRKGTNLGHESEVLLAAGAELVLRSETLIHEDYLAGKWGYPEKRIPVYVLEIDVS